MLETIIESKELVKKAKTFNKAWLMAGGALYDITQEGKIIPNLLPKDQNYAIDQIDAEGIILEAGASEPTTIKFSDGAHKYAARTNCHFDVPQKGFFERFKERHPSIYNALAVGAPLALMGLAAVATSGCISAPHEAHNTPSNNDVTPTDKAFDNNGNPLIVYAEFKSNSTTLDILLNIMNAAGDLRYEFPIPFAGQSGEFHAQGNNYTAKANISGIADNGAIEIYMLGTHFFSYRWLNGPPAQDKHTIFKIDDKRANIVSVPGSQIGGGDVYSIPADKLMRSSETPEISLSQLSPDDDPYQVRVRVGGKQTGVDDQLAFCEVMYYYVE